MKNLWDKISLPIAMVITSFAAVAGIGFLVYRLYQDGGLTLFLILGSIGILIWALCKVFNWWVGDDFWDIDDWI